MKNSFKGLVHPKKQTNTHKKKTFLSLGGGHVNVLEQFLLLKKWSLLKIFTMRFVDYLNMFNFV